MNRLLRWLDPIFGLALVAALLMVVITAWPGAAVAADGQTGNGDAATEQRSLADIDAVQTLGPRVVVRQGAANALTVRADRNLLPLIETVVVGSGQGQTLVVRWKRGALIRTRVQPEVTVTVVQLSALLVSGSGDLVAGPFKLPRLSARVEGSGDVALEGLAVDELKLAVIGSGDIVASGQATRLTVSVAGSGDIDAGTLKSDDVSVSVAGSGDVTVSADRTLAVSIAGSGDVLYSGNAKVTKNVAGSGEVIRR